MIQRVDENEGSSEFQFCHYTPELMADMVRTHGSQTDIWSEAGLRAGVVRRAKPLDDLVPEPLFRRSTLWTEVLRPHGDDTAHSVGLILPDKAGPLCVSVHRAGALGAFTGEDAMRMDMAGAVDQRIYRARRMLDARDAKIDRMTQLLAAEAACCSAPSCACWRRARRRRRCSTGAMGWR
ncbi:hypothetical protein AB5I41_28030 [Sphingomonas sp. MMS24-JH45]